MVKLHVHRLLPAIYATSELKTSYRVPLPYQYIRIYSRFSNISFLFLYQPFQIYISWEALFHTRTTFSIRSSQEAYSPPTFRLYIALSQYVIGSTALAMGSYYAVICDHPRASRPARHLPQPQLPARRFQKPISQTYRSRSQWDGTAWTTSQWSP